MAFKSLTDLPKPVRHVLPKRAQAIFLEAFNSAWENYGHDEERSFRIAWTAVKRKYKKDERSSKWKVKKSR